MGYSITCGAEGSVQYLLSPILCFIKHCYDKEEFDTDHSQRYFNMLYYFSCIHEDWPVLGLFVIFVQDRACNCQSKITILP